jgi:hypothetical protein
LWQLPISIVGDWSTIVVIQQNLVVFVDTLVDDIVTKAMVEP